MIRAVVVSAVVHPSPAPSELAYSLVRLMVRDHLGSTCPGKLHIARGAHGKPFLVDVEGLYFSVSHSGPWVAACIGKTPIGIDIQTPPSILRPATLRRFGLPQGTSPEAFAMAWARREAALKAIGTGFAQGPNPAAESLCHIQSHTLPNHIALAIAEQVSIIEALPAQNACQYNQDS